jgi:hypothetical protein
MRDFIENRVRTNSGEMIVDAFPSGNVPFQESDPGAATEDVWLARTGQSLRGLS